VIPTVGGFTNLIYGIAQGLFSEAGYAVLRYRSWGIPAGALAGALAGIPAVALDAVLFGSIAPPGVMALWLLAAMVSGGIYGAIAASAMKALRG